MTVSKVHTVPKPTILMITRCWNRKEEWWWVGV